MVYFLSFWLLIFSLIPKEKGGITNDYVRESLTAGFECVNYDSEIGLQKMDYDQMHEYFATLIVTVNNFLAPYERIVDFRIIDRSFSTEEGELTAKGTYKRRQIENNFDSIIEEMYTKNFAGLLQSYAMAIPFFHNTLISTFLYLIVLKLIFDLAIKKTYKISA